MFKRFSRLAIVFAFAGWANSATSLPITDTVLVNGSEWAQADLFTNLSWNQMNAACPAGVCNGQLNGHDMTGWLWANTEAVTDLFNHYIGSPQLGISNGLYQSGGTIFGEAFFADGWRAIPNTTPSGAIGISTVGRKSGNEGLAFIGYTRFLNMSEANLYQSERYFSAVGGWFVKAPQAAIPIPSTIVLLGIGLTFLGYGARRRT